MRINACYCRQRPRNDCINAQPTGRPQEDCGGADRGAYGIGPGPNTICPGGLRIGGGWTLRGHTWPDALLHVGLQNAERAFMTLHGQLQGV